MFPSSRLGFRIFFRLVALHLGQWKYFLLLKTQCLEMQAWQKVCPQCMETGSWKQSKQMEQTSSSLSLLVNSSVDMMPVCAKQFRFAAVARYPSGETVLCSHCFHKKKKVLKIYTNNNRINETSEDFRVSHGGKKREKKVVKELKSDMESTVMCFRLKQDPEKKQLNRRSRKCWKWWFMYQKSGWAQTYSMREFVGADWQNSRFLAKEEIRKELSHSSSNKGFM